MGVTAWLLRRSHVTKFELPCPNHASKKRHSEANGMGGNHQQQGKGVLGGETLKPPRLLRRGHMEHPGHLEHPSFLEHPGLLEHPGDQKKIKLGVPLVQLVRSLVVLMTIILAMVLLGKLR